MRQPGALLGYTKIYVKLQVWYVSNHKLAVIYEAPICTSDLEEILAVFSSDKSPFKS